MMTKHIILIGLIAALARAIGAANHEPELAEAIQTIRAVGPEGRGNADAARAWKKLAAGNSTSIVPLLAGMDDANDLAVNWFRSAVHTVVSRDSTESLPLAELGKFLLDTRHHPRARRLAFELIARIDAVSAEKLLPGLLNDPSLELRRDAVQKVIDEAAQSFASRNKVGATLLYQQALNFARDVEQTDIVAKKLKDLGQPVDLVKHFGFLVQWNIIGPFDNSGGKGFDTVYPPETTVDLTREYDGKLGKVRWQDFTSTHAYGKVDANKPCGSLKGVTAYAYTEFNSSRVQPAELRVACKNGWKIWCNGQFIFGRDEYHRMTEIDQYRLPVTLKAGRNVLLVKVCQNEQVEEWTKEWEFQLRVTDSLGTPIPFAADTVKSARINESKN